MRTFMVRPPEPEVIHGLGGYDGLDGAEGPPGPAGKGEKGEKGERGEPGPPGKDAEGHGFTWRDEWREGETYEPQDLAYLDRSTYLCVVAHTADHFNGPRPDSYHWRFFARGGMSGMPGERGVQGMPGEITQATFDAHKTSSDHDGRYYTETESDARFLGLARMRAQRVTTGSIPATASADVILTWTPAFDDANYTVTVSVEVDTTMLNTLRVRRISSRTATEIVARIENEHPLAAITGILHGIAIADA